MSSNYDIVCMGHDPAILIDRYEFSDPAPALAAVASRHGPGEKHPVVQEHPSCDLVVIRRSGGWVEVCCPPTQLNGEPRLGHASFHPHDGEWTGVGWLRLMLLAGPELAKRAFPSHCWSFERAYRLRMLLLDASDLP